MIICLQHPEYKAPDIPVIACKTCCQLFIDEVKRCREAGEVSPMKYIQLITQRQTTPSRSKKKACSEIENKAEASVKN